MTHGQGVFIHDDAGNAFLDAGAGLWCASLGYANERLARTAYEAMRTLGYYQLFRHASHPAAIELSEKLLSIAPVPMSKVLLQCSGSEANDTALKLVWYHWNARGQPQRRKVISRLGSYHGSTCATISLTGKPDYHAGFGLPFEGFRYVDCPNHYRAAEPGESEEAFSARMAAQLEALILAEGPETVAAFWADPVQGGAGGLPPPRGYFERVQEVLRRHGVLFVADEVICGFGRTGAMWGCETYAITPDILCCAKALSAAMQPISAVLINEEIFQSLLTQSDRLGAFIHGFTYAGHPVCSAVALETLRIYEEMDLIGHVREVEPVFLRELGALQDHPMIGHFNGCGLIGGMEMVRDKDTRADWPAEAKLGARLDEAARRNGLILRIVGNRIAFSPPLIITAAEIQDLAGRLRRSLDEVHAELVAL